MATITATPTSAPRTRRGVRDRVRAAWARAAPRAVAAVSTVRRSPVLTALGLGFIDISAWETCGRGAGWLALGVSVLLYDWHRD